MDARAVFETASDWLVMVGLGALLAAVYGSWLASYRTPGTAPTGTSLWFRLPVWGQIAGGLGISLVGVAGGAALWQPLPISLPDGVRLGLRLAGLLLSGLAIGLWFWTRWALGTMMGVSTGAAAQLRAGHRLVTRGPYAHVRHPMYLSYWLLLAGLTLIYRTWPPLLLLALMFAALARRARREDQVLGTTLGAEWLAYAARVPAFWPRRSGRK